MSLGPFTRSRSLGQRMSRVAPLGNHVGKAGLSPIHRKRHHSLDGDPTDCPKSRCLENLEFLTQRRKDAKTQRRGGAETQSNFLDHRKQFSTGCDGFVFVFVSSWCLGGCDGAMDLRRSASSVGSLRWVRWQIRNPKFEIRNYLFTPSASVAGTDSRQCVR